MAASDPADDEHQSRQEEAARLRAAFAYGRIPKQQRAELLGVAERTVTRIENGESDMPPGRWLAVLEATGAPAWFARPGFRRAAGDVSDQRVSRLEARMARLETALLAAGASALADGSSARPERAGEAESPGRPS